MKQVSVGGQRFLALDALRGLAALWVVYFHVYGGLGYLAVDFFLVLSGFIWKSPWVSVCAGAW